MPLGRDEKRTVPRFIGGRAKKKRQIDERIREGRIQEILINTPNALTLGLK